jgi:hypothetical protein
MRDMGGMGGMPLPDHDVLMVVGLVGMSGLGMSRVWSSTALTHHEPSSPNPSARNVAGIADSRHLKSIFVDFVPRLGWRRASHDGERFINAWRNHGRNRLSISLDGHGST